MTTADEKYYADIAAQIAGAEFSRADLKGAIQLAMGIAHAKGRIERIQEVMAETAAKLAEIKERMQAVPVTGEVGS
jgi:ABC-type Fe3+-hydroxamate transport system substrate-binding protein